MEFWAVFLGYADKPEYRDLVNKVIEKKEALKVASEVLMEISKDEHERALFRSRRMYQMDLESNLAAATRMGEEKGEAKGRAEGEAKGMAKGKADVAKMMIANAMPIEEIMKYTGLTRAEIEGLRQ